MKDAAKNERRVQSAYYATTHRVRRTMLSDAAILELCDAHLEALADLRELEASHEVKDRTLDEALKERDHLRAQVARLLRRGSTEGEG